MKTCPLLSHVFAEAASSWDDERAQRRQTSFSRLLRGEFVDMGHPEKTQIFCECTFCHLRGRAISVRAHVFWSPTNVVLREMHSRFVPAQRLPEMYRSV